jgi:hypothetical protein
MEDDEEKRVYIESIENENKKLIKENKKLKDLLFNRSMNMERIEKEYAKLKEKYDNLKLTTEQDIEESIKKKNPRKNSNFFEKFNVLSPRNKKTEMSIEETLSPISIENIRKLKEEYMEDSPKNKKESPRSKEESTTKRIDSPRREEKKIEIREIKKPSNNNHEKESPKSTTENGIKKEEEAEEEERKKKIIKMKEIEENIIKIIEGPNQSENRKKKRSILKNNKKEKETIMNEIEIIMNKLKEIEKKNFFLEKYFEIKDDLNKGKKIYKKDLFDNNKIIKNINLLNIFKEKISKTEILNEKQVQNFNELKNLIEELLKLIEINENQYKKRSKNEKEEEGKEIMIFQSNKKTFQSIKAILMFNVDKGQFKLNIIDSNINKPRMTSRRKTLELKKLNFEGSGFIFKNIDKGKLKTNENIRIIEILEFHEILIVFLPSVHLKSTKLLLSNIYDHYISLLKMNIVPIMIPIEGETFFENYLNNNDLKKYLMLTRIYDEMSYLRENFGIKNSIESLRSDKFDDFEKIINFENLNSLGKLNNL